MSKTTNKLSLEVRARAVRMILDHEGDYPSRWSAVVSVADNPGAVQYPGRSSDPDRSLAAALQYRQAPQRAGLPASGPGNGNTAMAALRFRFASPAASHGAGGCFTLTNHTDHSVGAGHHGAFLSVEGTPRSQATSPLSKPRQYQTTSSHATLPRSGFMR
jgi:hypothetical protein